MKSKNLQNQQLALFVTLYPSKIFLYLTIELLRVANLRLIL